MNDNHVQALRRVARKAMLERGLAPDFSPAALRQLTDIQQAAKEPVLDQTKLLWCSIDNDESRDLDQLSVCEELPGGAVRILVAVADVDALVPIGTPLDAHAWQNTTSVYTAAQIFPMLPEKLSTDLSSLNADVDRLAVVIEYVVAQDGTVSGGKVYRALVHNYAKLAYDSVAAWLDGKGQMPAPVARVQGMERQIRVQDAAAQRLRKRRMEAGALEFRSIEARAVIQGEQVVDMREQEQNRARQLIEELMIASNGVSAEFLAGHKSPSLRRIVRDPERWQKIVAVAAEYGEQLPGTPDSKPLEAFLRKQRAKDPDRFPDLSLRIVKLMGRGEYVADAPGVEAPGHFGLAVKDYSHTTAPNRRYPDLITHRLLKSALAGARTAYSYGELEALAQRCTEMEANATKVERQVRKSAAALVLQSRVGQVFDGFVTGASPKGTYVRIVSPPAEGRIVRGEMGLKVSDRVRVKLLATDFERGFLDFGRER